jgi:predicted MFS family arabinose efflux permease
MEADVASTSHEGAQNNTGGVTRRDVLDAVTDWRKLLTVVFNVLATLPVSAFGYFMPLIVKGMGYSGVDASLMSVSPFVVGACGLFAFVYASDRLRERSIIVSSSMMLAIVGLVVMYTSEKPELRYAFVHVCLAGAFTAGPLIVAWLAGNTPEKVCLDLPSTSRTVLIYTFRPKDPLLLVSTAGATLPVSSQDSSSNQNTDLTVKY